MSLEGVSTGGRAILRLLLSRLGADPWPDMSLLVYKGGLGSVGDRSHWSCGGRND